MAALGHVVDAGRLSLPEIPIEAARHGRRLERPAAQTAGDDGGHLSEFAESSIAN